MRVDPSGARSNDVVPGPQPDLGGGPRTGGPPRTDCTDDTVTASGQLVAGVGTVTITARPSAPPCYLGGTVTDLELFDRAGTPIDVTSIDPTASVAINPPQYGWARLGHDGPATFELTTIAFKIVLTGNYCGSVPTQLRFADSTWGNPSVAITATLTDTSPPCDASRAENSNTDTITAYPLGGYPLPAPGWAFLRASIRSQPPDATHPSLVVRLTNPTSDAVPLRPCFQYALGLVTTGPDWRGGVAAFGMPDCARMPAALAPNASVDLDVDTSELQPVDAVESTVTTLTWLMPGGPTATVSYPPSERTMTDSPRESRG